MTKQEKIKTILRSELIQWKTFSREKLLENLLMLEEDILENLDTQSLDELVADIDLAEVWGQALETN
jgi:hypothetical protein